MILPIPIVILLPKITMHEPVSETLSKVYDDKKDIALIGLLNPLLIEIIQKCEPLENGD
jgi:hypothetical protein